MTTTTKSQFDTGNWSDVNGLPGQDDMIHFMEHLLQSNPHKCFSRRQLMDSVAREFGIPATAQEADGPKSSTPGYYTRLTYLITDAVQGKRRADGNPFAKRIGPGVYQHISGDGKLSVEFKKAPKVPKRLLDQARVSVKILKSLSTPHTPEQIFVELGGKWPDDVIEAAIKSEFPEFV